MRNQSVGVLGGCMVAKLQLEGLDGGAPPGVELAFFFFGLTKSKRRKD